jgi:3-dehydroquinate synthase
VTRIIDVPGYQVRVGHGLLSSLGETCRRVAPAHRYAVISDEEVARHWLAPVTATISIATPDAMVMSTAVPAGEESKSRARWSALTDWLLGEGAGRDTTIVALGGGVVGDLAGFVAATYLRGIPVVQVPTSLLAMVDASVGGKTGVDTPHGKNLVGAFHQPAAVVVDPATLSTPPPAHLRAGLAEVIKHGAIADAAYFSDCATWAADVHRAVTAGTAFDGSDRRTLDVIARSIEIKAEVVAEDPLERGRRAILNAGHTVAHGLERETGYRLLHGEAVAIGLVAEAELGEAAGITAAGTARLLRDALGGAGLPIHIPAGVEISRLVDAMRIDKKSRQGQLSFAFLASIGTPAGSDAAGWSTVLDEGQVRGVLLSPAVTAG